MIDLEKLRKEIEELSDLASRDQLDLRENELVELRQEMIQFLKLTREI